MLLFFGVKLSFSVWMRRRDTTELGLFFAVVDWILRRGASLCIIAKKNL